MGLFVVKVKQVNSSNKNLIENSLGEKQLKIDFSFAKPKPVYENEKRTDITQFFNYKR